MKGVFKGLCGKGSSERFSVYQKKKSIYTPPCIHTQWNQNIYYEVIYATSVGLVIDKNIASICHAGSDNWSIKPNKCFWKGEKHSCLIVPLKNAASLLTLRQREMIKVQNVYKSSKVSFRSLETHKAARIREEHDIPGRRELSSPDIPHSRSRDVFSPTKTPAGFFSWISSMAHTEAEQ